LTEGEFKMGGFRADFRVRINRLRCSKCGKLIGRNNPEFGPPQVYCGNCGSLVETNLPGWEDLAPGEKLGLTFREMFLPPFIKVAPDCSGLIAIGVTHFFLWTVAMVPFLVVGMSLGLDSALGTLLMLVGMIAYPLLLYFRFYRVVQESKQRSSPPTWT
jgi:hypothetical protein